MLLGGVSSHKDSANEFFSETKTLSGLGLARIPRTRRVCLLRFQFRYSGVIGRGFCENSGLEPDIATSSRISVCAGVDVSRKEAVVKRRMQKRSKDVEYETEMLSGKGHKDVNFAVASHKPFGKDFSVLATLLPGQDRKSASSSEGQKQPPPRDDPGRFRNQSVGSARTIENVLKSWSSQVENNVGSNSGLNETLSKRNSFRKDSEQLQKRQLVGRKISVDRGKPRKVSEEKSIDSSVSKGQSEGNIFGKGTTQGKGNVKIFQPSKTILASPQPFEQASPSVERDTIDSTAEKPSLRGQDILLAMQKAAVERAKLKQRNRTASERNAKVRGNISSQETLDWRNAKPVVIRPEWALQIESLESRIKDLKNQIRKL